SLVTILSLGRAEQQSELEEAAKRYEAEGKAHIAQALRQQAGRLTNCDPAADAKRICAHLADSASDGGTGASGDSSRETGRLPDFSTPPVRARRKKPRGEEVDRHTDERTTCDPEC